jgi:hypothetical protein
MATATGFVALTLPGCRFITPILDLTAECSTPFREPLQFIVITVISVISGTFPIPMGLSSRRWITSVSGDRHAIGMFIVMEE